MTSLGAASTIFFGSPLTGRFLVQNSIKLTVWGRYKKFSIYAEPVFFNDVVFCWNFKINNCRNSKPSTNIRYFTR